MSILVREVLDHVLIDSVFHAEAPRLDEVQRKVKEFLQDRVVVGHALHNDFNVLDHAHPPHLVRDTAKYPPFTKDGKGARSLKALTKDILVCLTSIGPGSTPSA